MSDTICVPRPGRRRARRLGLGLAAAAALLVSTGPSAHAQDDTGDTATTEIKGTLKTADDAGEEVLLEG
ncbi:MAG: hypothetical protein ACO23O_13690, partial [Ilumatobacteraceae bacterium]